MESKLGHAVDSHDGSRPAAATVLLCAGRSLGNRELQTELAYPSVFRGPYLVRVNLEFDKVASYVAGLCLIDVDADPIGAGIAPDFTDAVVLGLPADECALFVTPDRGIFVGGRILQLDIDHLNGRCWILPDVLAG